MPSTTIEQLRNSYAKQVMAQCGEYVKIRRDECKRLGLWMVRGKENFRTKCHLKIKPRGKAYDRILSIEQDAFIAKAVNRVTSEDYQKIVREKSKDFYNYLKSGHGNT